jgi:hypothetical protein
MKVLAPIANRSGYRVTILRSSATTGACSCATCKSTLGTAVNGVPIGSHFGADEAPLQAGDNEIVAGDVGSPFVSRSK